MTERRVWLAQYLCPQRHCIGMVPGEADDAADAQRLADQVRDKVDEMLQAGSINPWCGICGAKRETWKVELGRTQFRTMAEAAVPLAESQAKQMLTSRIYGTHGPKPPGRS